MALSNVYQSKEIFMVKEMLYGSHNSRIAYFILSKFLKKKEELKTIQRIKYSFLSNSTVKFFFDIDLNESPWNSKRI